MGNKKSLAFICAPGKTGLACKNSVVVANRRYRLPSPSDPPTGLHKIIQLSSISQGHALTRFFFKRHRKKINTILARRLTTALRD